MACKVHVERGVQYDAARLIISGSENRSRPAKMSDRGNSSSAL
jgi:hypothetical protein